MTIRRLLFWLHIWVGLALCLPFALLGLTGSLLVYEQPIDDFFAPLPHASSGEIHSPQAILDAALKARDGLAATSLSMPPDSGEPAIVRLTKKEEGGAARGRRGGVNYQALVDPVSLQVLDVRTGARSYVMGLVHDFHGSLLLGGRDGRPLVGWLGVGMLALGISALVLWWPRNRNWRDAYGVTKNARGWLLYRQLHGTAGITAWLLFMVLSFSGIAISFPQTTTAFVRTVLFQGPSSIAPADPGFNGPRVTPLDGVTRIDADKALAVAMAAAPGTRLVTMFLPNGAEQPYRFSLLPKDAAQGSPAIIALVDPYRAEIVSLRDPWAGDLGDNAMTWQRPLHTGRGTNAVYRAFIFVVGLLPPLFAVTGVLMWWSKRRARGKPRVDRHPQWEGVAAE